MGMLRTGALALAGVVCLGSVVRADDWRLGAEVGLTGASLGGLGGTGIVGRTTSGTAGLEYRLSPRWWMVARVSGNVHTSEAWDLWNVGVGVGARFVLNPYDRVRVSVSGVLDVNRGAQTTLEGDEQIDDDWQGAGLTIGMAVDLRLVDDLDLRLALQLVRFALSDATFENRDPSFDTLFDVTFDMAPTLGLAITF